MLDNLINLVREHAQDAIVNNTEVPNEHNEAAIQAASSSIFDTLKEQVSSGNIGDLVNAFKQNAADSNSGLVQQATSTFTEKLGGLGINTDTAKSIGASLIPAVIGKFINKTNDPNDNSFNIQDVIGKLAGGADGKFDLSDITSLFGGSAEPGAASSGGGILDKLKGLFK